MDREVIEMLDVASPSPRLPHSVRRHRGHPLPVYFHQPAADQPAQGVLDRTLRQSGAICDVPQIRYYSRGCAPCAQRGTVVPFPRNTR
jgi:hypothetical protein